MQAAACLQQTGVSQGDSVALMVDDPVDFCRQWLGLTFIGATMVAINTSMRGTPLTHQLSIASVTTVIVDANHLPTIEAIDTDATILHIDKLSSTSMQKQTQPQPQAQLPEISHTDRACIMFTSGTSGPSKGVEMPHAHCVLFAIGTIENYRLQPTDTFYNCLPLFHANGLFMQLLACLINGTKAVIRNKFSATQWLTDIRTSGATHTNTLGAVAAFIVAQPATADDTNHQLRVIGAAPLKLGESAPGTCGRVYDKYFDVEIRDTNSDEPVDDNVTGEIMVRPKQPYGFMSGYVGMPEKTLEAWRNFWFHTGDAAYRNEYGQFVFVDRIKDCIRRRGENISSYEVEQAFLAIDDIAEAAAYAVPATGINKRTDGNSGNSTGDRLDTRLDSRSVKTDEGMEDEVMVALMITGNSHDWPKWMEAALVNLPAFAAPRYLRIMSDFPKTPTGKVRKVALRTEGITTDTIDTQANDRR